METMQPSKRRVSIPGNIVVTTSMLASTLRRKSPGDPVVMLGDGPSTIMNGIWVSNHPESIRREKKHAWCGRCIHCTFQGMCKNNGVVPPVDRCVNFVLDDSP